MRVQNRWARVHLAWPLALLASCSTSEGDSGGEPVGNSVGNSAGIYGAHGPVQDSAQVTSSAGLVSGEGFEGFIFPASKGAQTRWLGREEAPAYWTPDSEDVTRFEAGLRSALEAGLAEPRSIDPHIELYGRDEQWVQTQVPEILERLDGFRRQYFGVTDAEGKRRLLVRFFPGPNQDAGFPFEKWTEEVVIVSDGGFWYWTFEFDVEDGEYGNFDSNGYA